MELQDLSVKDYLAHLQRHPMPEIISDECMAALSNVRAQYGDALTHCAGLEVRLGDPERYIDYIMEFDESGIPGADRLWYELDYGDIAKGGQLQPCLFYTAYWNAATDKGCIKELLTGFLGKKRAGSLYHPLLRIMAVDSAMYVRSIGTMTSRNELDIMRMVLYFPTWEGIFRGLSDIGWKGDIKALRAALEPWKDAWSTEVAVDLGPEGVLPKIGFEIFSPYWKHPQLMDRVIARLEDAGLCLPSKGAALRRWIRLLPDGDPFIQTFIAYFKLNYKDGKINEAKAYLEQAPSPGHYYYNAYAQPVFADMELKNRSDTLSLKDATHWLDELNANRVRNVRLIGDVPAYEPIRELLAHCKKLGICSQIFIGSNVSEEWLAGISAAGVSGFIIDFDILKTLQGVDVAKVSALWYMSKDNADALPQVVSAAEKLGVKELILTGMTPQKTAKGYPDREQLLQAARAIRNVKAQLTLTVDSCFSPLRAILGGEDPRRNTNRGIERGCSAGRDRFCIRASGRLSPCIYMEASETFNSLAAYWNHSETLQKLRSREKNTAAACKDCCYRRHCLSCECKPQ